ncbi:hypothetical protein GA0061071_107187 [Kosakonia oryzendophytica]|uniref:Uncharacterized protein n=1 Tax=Kosakonia oryzendophytica TaxID=1005665 RepID=A0A1C4CFM0_9ENTR|nr:hypothetical protein [Kosakonia oryzendophytica]SCC17798.1 hypothetical protein GA0061071_107187 [Kosakonia oryzendophytica]
MALEDYSAYFMYGGMVVTVAATVFFWWIEKRDNTDVVGIKHCLTSAEWSGEFFDSYIESWQQTNARYGNAFFYDITFCLEGEQKMFTAKALVNPGEMHLLKKGLRIRVKKGSKNRIAVTDITVADC